MKNRARRYKYNRITPKGRLKLLRLNLLATKFLTLCFTSYKSITLSLFISKKIKEKQTFSLTTYSTVSDCKFKKKFLYNRNENGKILKIFFVVQGLELWEMWKYIVVKEHSDMFLLCILLSNFKDVKYL